MDVSNLSKSCRFTRIGPGKHRITFDATWSGAGGVPFGGYTVAVAISAMREELGDNNGTTNGEPKDPEGRLKYPHVISCSTEIFAAPARDVDCLAKVTVHRRGNSFATAWVVLSEFKDSSKDSSKRNEASDSAPFVSAMATFGRLPVDGKHEVNPWFVRPPSKAHTTLSPTNLVDGFSLSSLSGWGSGPLFTRKFRFGVSPKSFEKIANDMALARTLPTDDPRRFLVGSDMDMWVRMDDGQVLDDLAIATISDMIGGLVRKAFSSKSELVSIRFKFSNSISPSLLLSSAFFRRQLFAHIQKNHGLRFMRNGSESPPGTVSPHSTLSHSLHFLSSPLPNSRWCRIRPTILLRKGTMVEYEVTIWREDGEVLAVGRQMALVRAMQMDKIEPGLAKFLEPGEYTVPPSVEEGPMRGELGREKKGSLKL